MADILRGVIYDSSPNCQIGLEACIQSNVQALAGFISSVVSTHHDGSEAGQKAAALEARKAVNVLIGPQSPFKAHMMTKPVKMVCSQSCEDGAVAHRLEPPVDLQFIYSQDDTIITVDGVERYIRQVTDRPNRKTLMKPGSLSFEKSRHCFHKKIHKEEYFRCVRTFAKRVLAA